mgnify:FL=1
MDSLMGQIVLMRIKKWIFHKENGGTDMEFTEMDEVRVRTYGGAIGTIERVIYEMVDSKETDNVYCYEMEINGKHGVIVYPDEIDE